MKLYPDWLPLVLQEASTGTSPESFVQMFERFAAELRNTGVADSQSAMRLLGNEFPELDARQINEMLGYYIKRKASQG